TTTFIISSEIYNNLLMDRLKILSSKDMLTGVMNRNEMNNYVDKLSAVEDSEPISVGTIFTDLNGLKIVNDEQGHVAGDKLLKAAANALEEVFDESCIFRAGGDEFTIIVIGISEEELKKDIELIREAEEKYDVSFAIGASFESDRKNVRAALRKADEEMYADKKRYYELHPDKKR
nr:GGDEF domain-containing protein [Eubacterium sp.]